MLRVLLVMLLIPMLSWAQNKYGLQTMRLQEYKSSLASHPEKQLVDLQKELPGVTFQIGYATTENFTKTKIYTLAKAYARKPVAESLKHAQADFLKMGYSIKIYDAYRPYSATVKFYETYHDTTYVASPYKGSRHNRGCALDMTIVDVKTRKELPMPTEWDSFSTDAWPRADIKDPVKRKNRDLLISVMEKNGFRVYEHEWWHFDFVGWEKFEVMDIDFEELK